MFTLWKCILHACPESNLGQKQKDNTKAFIGDPNTLPTSKSRAYDAQGTLRIHKVANFMDPFHSNLLKHEENRKKNLDLATQSNKV